MFSKYLSQKYQLSFICPALFFLSFGLSSDVLSEDTGVLPGPSAHAGPDQVSLVGEPVFFYGSGSTHDYEIIQYEWDFDGDGDIDCFSDKPDTTAFTFSSPGRYRCTLTVSDSAGESVTDECFITVARNSTELPAISAQHQPLFEDSGLPADGIVHQYSIIINGGSEARYWTDVELTYRMLTEGYGFTDSDIFLLNYRGLNPTDENPEGMIDGPAYVENVEQTFQEIAAIADADDELYLWLHDHGRGYSGLLSQGGIYYGYCDGRISVDPGDEPDFIESDFKLRSIFTGGDYRCNHGLNVWVVRKKYYTSLRTNYYRNKYVSQFNNVYIENLGRKIRDRDIFIERFVDYLMGDTNKDGYI